MFRKYFPICWGHAGQDNDHEEPLSSSKTVVSFTKPETMRWTWLLFCCGYGRPNQTYKTAYLMMFFFTFSQIESLMLTLVNHQLSASLRALFNSLRHFLVGLFAKQLPATSVHSFSLQFIIFVYCFVSAFLFLSESEDHPFWRRIDAIKYKKTSNIIAYIWTPMQVKLLFMRIMVI